ETAAFIRRACFTYLHPVGTCAMGSGRVAVVDAELRVQGIEGLRIADASVMPTIPSANTNAPTVMIGEFASRLIVARCSNSASVPGEPFIVHESRNPTMNASVHHTTSPMSAFKRAPSLELSTWYMGNLTTYLAEQKDTSGTFTLVEGMLAPGTE